MEFRFFVLRYGNFQEYQLNGYLFDFIKTMGCRQSVRNKTRLISLVFNLTFGGFGCLSRPFFLNPNGMSGSLSDMTDKRTDSRRHFYQECFLSIGVDEIKSRIVNVSKMGVGVWVNKSAPFKVGKNLFIKSEYFQYQSAQVQWIKKNADSNTSRLGLQLSTSLFN